MLICQIFPYLAPTLLPASLDTNSCCLTDSPPHPPIGSLTPTHPHVATTAVTMSPNMNTFFSRGRHSTHGSCLLRGICLLPCAHHLKMRQICLTIKLQKKTGKYLALSIWGGAWRLSNPEIRHPPPAFLLPLLLLQTSRLHFLSVPTSRREGIYHQEPKEWKL